MSVLFIKKIIQALESGKKSFLGSQPDDPFRVLIATVLSQRTRDENTHKATENLFKKYRTPTQLANAKLSEIKKLIKPSGFYKVKAKRIKDISKIITKEYNGKVPDDLKKLLTLPGVGRKTANCVLVYGHRKPAIPVDTHVHRISNRLGLVQTKTPKETEERLINLVPKKYWLELNELFVIHGRNICLPRNPKCLNCPLKQDCKYFNTVLNKFFQALERP